MLNVTQIQCNRISPSILDKINTVLVSWKLEVMEVQKSAKSAEV